MNHLEPVEKLVLDVKMFVCPCLSEHCRDRWGQHILVVPSVQILDGFDFQNYANIVGDLTSPSQLYYIIDV